MIKIKINMIIEIDLYEIFFAHSDKFCIFTKIVNAKTVKFSCRKVRSCNFYLYSISDCKKCYLFLYSISDCMKVPANNRGN